MIAPETAEVLQKLTVSFKNPDGTPAGPEETFTITPGQEVYPLTEPINALVVTLLFEDPKPTPEDQNESTPIPVFFALHVCAEGTSKWNKNSIVDFLLYPKQNFHLKLILICFNLSYWTNHCSWHHY